MPITKKKRFWSERTLRGLHKHRKRKVRVPKYVLLGMRKCKKCGRLYGEAFVVCPTCMVRAQNKQKRVDLRYMERIEWRHKSNLYVSPKQEREYSKALARRYGFKWRRG